MIDFAKLAAPFAPDRISWRVGSTTQDKKRGLAFAYIDARDVMARLDEVCGPGGWQCRYPHAAAKTVCEIGVLANGDWIWKADGAGDTDVESEKGALSDAFKRAAVRWGIGRYLYDVDTPWIEIEPMGKSFKIADSAMPKLHALLSKKAAPAAAAPRPTASVAPPPAPAPNDWEIIVNDIIGEIAKTKTGAEMDALGDANKRRMEKMPAEFKQRVYAVAKRHREQIALPAMAAG